MICAAEGCGRVAANTAGYCCDLCEFAWRSRSAPTAMHSGRCDRATEFDAAEAARLRDEAIGRVEAHAEAAWMETALDAVRIVASTSPVLTADDVWRHIPTNPREPRAMGPVMRRAAREGIIEWTGELRQSDRKSCHRQWKRIWRSRILP